MTQNRSILITGDTHGDLSTGKLKRWKKRNRKAGYTKEDYLIIAGDVGFNWLGDSEGSRKFVMNYFAHQPYTTLFVDGNHDNHPWLQSLPLIPMFGGMVGKVMDSIYYLRRGQIYTIHGKTFFTMGGAISMDKMYRREGISWWKEEVPSCAEMDLAIETLRSCQWKVDYVITHTLPIDVIPRMGFMDLIEPNQHDAVVNFLQHIAENLNFTRWFCGHFHQDKTWNKFTVLWNEIVELEVEIPEKDLTADGNMIGLGART